MILPSTVPVSKNMHVGLQLNNSRWLRSKPGVQTFKWFLDIIIMSVRALEIIHRRGIYHQAITPSPAEVLILPPWLLQGLLLVHWAIKQRVVLLAERALVCAGTVAASCQCTQRITGPGCQLHPTLPRDLTTTMRTFEPLGLHRHGGWVNIEKVIGARLKRHADRNAQLFTSL